jgi:DNA-binding transcriptional LysR family regulator
MEQVQDGSLDIAIIYAAPRRLGVVAELLFEEKLVLVRTTPVNGPLRAEDHVDIDWGEEFTASYQAAFPDQPNAVVSVSHGPLALDYLLAIGGSGYFRKGFIQPYLDEGRLALVPDSPEFSYSAYVVHSTQADPGVMDRMRSGLRMAAAMTT